MIVRIARNHGLLVVMVVAGTMVAALPRPVHAQERPLAPAGEKLCTECGSALGTREICPFCGARQAGTGRTAEPTPAPARPSPDGDLPAPTSPGPKAPDAAGPPVTGPKPEVAPGKASPADAPPEDETTADARARAYKDDNMAKGDYYFKTGYYLKASESYRVAVLAEPGNAWKKLAFGHALFAIGNYSYSSYALRRATQQLDPKASFNPDVASLFPSKNAFEKAVKDLKRYVTYSPRDPAGLSVLGYMLFAQGEDDRAKEMFVYLQRLPKNDQDAFAGYFLKQIDGRKGGAPKGPELGAAKEPKVEPPRTEPVVPRKEPALPAKGVAPPEAARQDEEPANVKPAPARAIAE